MPLRESLFIEEKNYEEERKIWGEESKLTYLAIDKLQWKRVGERARVRADSVPKMHATVIFKLILKAIFHYYYSIISVRGKSIIPVLAHGEKITQM